MTDQRRWTMLNMADITASPRLFEPLEPCVEVVSMAPSHAALLKSIPRFDIYFASLHVCMNREVLERARRLRVIVTASTGLDHIDTDFAVERGITVLSLKADTRFLDSVTATAELTWALLLATVRRLPWAFAAVQQGRWARDEFRGRQLSGKTLGVLGYGRLGRMVAEFGKAFRMRVLACNNTPVAAAPGIPLVSFERLLEESDVLSIHIHLTEQNRRLIDASALARMKPGAILINTSRGGIVDEAALLDALDSGHLGGAGLDVIDGEWQPDLRSHALIAYSRTHQNLVISPHIGGVALEAQRAVFEHTVAKLKHHLQENRPS
jgi:D-3-phosphoglycerate dehydrogenase / 2-oxoglutarate reductase